MPTKIANENIAAVAARGAATIRSLREKVASQEVELHELRTKIASRDLEDQVQAIAKDMEAKGLNADLTFDEKIAHIRAHSNIENVREAVKMASSGQIRLASVSETPGRGAADALTQFCIGAE